MAHRDPVVGEEPTLGKLVSDAIGQTGELVHKLIALAKSELRLSVKAGGLGLGLFAAAGFLLVLGIIMLSVAIAYFVHMTGLDLAWCFLIVFGFYLLVAAILGFLGYRSVRKVRAPQRTIAEAQAAKAALTHSSSARPNRPIGG
jgi:uncharacterized membrane protein